MQVGTRYTVAIHILLCVEVFKETHKVTSDFIASSVKTNPVIIRNIMLQLRDAGLIQIARGTGGIALLRPTKELTLLDVYRAVESNKDGRLFRIHQDTAPGCPVGGNIEDLLTGYLSDAQQALETKLASTSLATLLSHLAKLWDKTPGQTLPESTVLGKAFTPDRTGHIAF